MEFNPWRTKTDYNFDELYEFQPIGAKGDIYHTDITVDGLNTNLEGEANIVRVSCTCQDYVQRRRICKHIKECTDIVNKAIKVRTEDGMKRFWCPTCHINCNTHELTPGCYECENKMLESDVK